jgi:cysteine desulfurase
VSVIVDGIDGESVLASLDGRGIFAATGSPCADLASLPSSSLLAAGYGPEEARSSIVFCIPPTGGPDEGRIDAAVEAVSEEIGRLRRIAGRMARPGP